MFIWNLYSLNYVMKMDGRTDMQILRANVQIIISLRCLSLFSSREVLSLRVMFTYFVDYYAAD